MDFLEGLNLLFGDLIFGLNFGMIGFILGSQVGFFLGVGGILNGVSVAHSAWVNVWMGFRVLWRCLVCWWFVLDPFSRVTIEILVGMFVECWEMLDFHREKMLSQAYCNNSESPWRTQRCCDRSSGSEWCHTPLFRVLTHAQGRSSYMFLMPLVFTKQQTLQKPPEQHVA